jgi:hypothetical protein
MKPRFMAPALLAALSANAQDVAIGYVKTVSGEASITTGGKQVKADVGAPVQQGSILCTGAKSSMGVTFKDETVMPFGPNTELTVDEYLYAPSQGKLKMGSKLNKGSLNYVSGENNPLVKTPDETAEPRNRRVEISLR